MDQLIKLVEMMLKHPDIQQRIMPLLRALIHSELLTELVKQSKSPVDDIILRILRTLVPPV